MPMMKIHRMLRRVRLRLMSPRYSASVAISQLWTGEYLLLMNGLHPRDFVGVKVSSRKEVFPTVTFL